MNQNKSTLWVLITKKINYSVHRLHVRTIVRILIEELIKDLKQGKEIKIINFGIFKLKDLKPKKIRSVSTKKIKFVKRTKSLRLKLTRTISKYLSNKSLEEMKNR